MPAQPVVLNPEAVAYATPVETDFHDYTWMAARIGRKPSWVRRYGASQLPHHKDGRLTRYCECCVERYREATRVAGEAEFQLSKRGAK